MANTASGTRRADILDAAIDLVASAGLRGLTHRAVDAAAGLPEGSTSAYFRTRQALVTAVVERLCERIGADVDALAAEVARHPGEPERAIELSLALFERWLADPAPLTARLELSLEAIRRPELQETVTAWRVAFESLVERILADAGIPWPGQRAGLVVAALDGILMRALLRPEAAGETPAAQTPVGQGRTLLTALLASAWRDVDESGGLTDVMGAS